MKKSIFFYAALATVALCTVSCSSDDDSAPYVPQQTVIPEPPTAQTATAFEIPETATQPKATVGDKTATVKSVNISESAKAVVKVDLSGEAKYLTFDSEYSKQGNKSVYTLKKGGVKKGTIEITDAPAAARRHGAAANNLVINLILEIPDDNGNVVTYPVPETTTQADPVEDTITPGQNTVNICRTWVIEQMTLTLKDNKVPGKSKITDFTLTEKSGNLKPLADKAQDNNAGLTPDEYDELCKAILGVTLDKAGKLSIEYSNGLTDACLWNWVGSDQTSIELKSEKGEKFGNKFLNEKSRITVNFWPVSAGYPNGLAHFIITTTVDTDTKNYDATVDFQVK